MAGSGAWAWAVVVAFALMALELHRFGLYADICLQCGGKGDHRDDCPLKEK